jgi:uncharacterized RmlC-like cupin family protein
VKIARRSRSSADRLFVRKYRERLENHMVNRAGDFVYIPANVPHLPYNLSGSEPATAVVARTDPNEQESVILLPELEAIHA